MRRIRTIGASTVVILRHQRGAVESDEISVDLDVAALVDAVTDGLLDALRGKSTPALAPTWTRVATTGATTVATAAIELENRTAPEYIARNFDDKVESVVPQTLDEWARDAID